MKLDRYIAHRGANKCYPENTMAAFQEAVKLGYTWIELDVQLSRDGVLFIFHDNNAKRLSNVDVDLTDLNWSEINQMSVLDSQPVAQKKYSIPTLKRYLDWMQSTPWLYSNLEIKAKAFCDKAYEIKLAKALVTLLKDYPALFPRLLLSSFSMTVLQEVAKHHLPIAQAMLLEIKDFDAYKKRSLSQQKKHYAQLNCYALGINNDILNPERVAFLKQYFSRILVYGSDIMTQKQADELIEMGADSVFVDALKPLNNNDQTPLSVGFLATGDEITTGDIINSNTPHLAREIYGLGLQTGMHVTSFDELDNIVAALTFLLQQHDVVITVGGLGPTEDDKTAEAIALVADKPLVFNEASWQRIYDRISKRFQQVPENNKKQAFFPQGALVLPNTLGTADGCYLRIKDKHLFMLPGPPNECMAMYEKDVKQRLMLYQRTLRHSYHWQLLGASEAHIAQKIKPLADKYNETLGYRAAYPYLEIKLHTFSAKEKIQPLVDEIDTAIADFIATRSKEVASQTLQHYIRSSIVRLKVQKDITKGYIHAKLAHMQTSLREPSFDVEIATEGLDNFWQNSTAVADKLFLTIKLINIKTDHKIEQQCDINCSTKGEQTFEFVYEWVCAQILRLLEKEVKR
ncbi:glycerophosphodiester phosphodiesterase family protein [Facilibium subflavum]|uniref:glycerophosphodiester phosphodiesterase family protein n=1 Tax=Facilibium subflavum TaxID=2219058 RepID=UPI000E64E9DB|nr:glycerophosphodiester phosphodiesterase family protein [Facilibium subflavum]